MVNTQQEPQPLEPKRVKSFATFFKNYMSLSSLVVAALPIPLTQFKMTPVYEVQKNQLSVYTSLYCFLLLGFIFFSRHILARKMFPRFLTPYTPEMTKTGGFSFRLQISMTKGWCRFVAYLPLLLILTSLGSMFMYHEVLNASIWEITLGEVKIEGVDTFSADSILKGLDIHQVFFSTSLTAYYLLAFLSAEAAFILMALKEYLQDLSGLSDMELILGKRLGVSSKQ